MKAVWYWSTGCVAVYSSVSLGLCVSQGAGAVICAWLCWRTKPPYTSRTRTPLQSDTSLTSVTPTPLSTSENTRPVSVELHAPSRCSWIVWQISCNIPYCQGWGRGRSLPICLQSPCDLLWESTMNIHTIDSFNFSLHGYTREEED